MSQLEANIEEMNNTDSNFDDNMLPPAPASVKRDVTVVLDNIPIDNISYDDYFNLPVPLLQRTTTTYGKHCTPGFNIEDEDEEDFKLPPGPVRIERQVTTWTGKDGEIVYNLPQYSNSFVSNICDNDLPTLTPELTESTTEEFIQEAYRQELLVCPGLEFKREHYSGLPYDPICLTHLTDDIREHLNFKLPFPSKLKRQTNTPTSGAHLSQRLDDMPPANPVFMRNDSIEHYINPFGRNDSS